MKLFISWSGATSRKVAEALRDWLPYLFQSLEPWMSSTDIDAGARWSRQIWDQLEASNFGILCLTRDNLMAPWILFEAGALAKTVVSSSVVPYLTTLDLVDLPAGPLTQFQAKTADRAGTWDMVRSINSALKENGRDIKVLEGVFDRFWPDLEKALASIPSEPLPQKRERPILEMVEEILLAVRSLERRAILLGTLPEDDIQLDVETNHLLQLLPPVMRDEMRQAQLERQRLERERLKMLLDAEDLRLPALLGLSKKDDRPTTERNRREKPAQPNAAPDANRGSRGRRR